MPLLHFLHFILQFQVVMLTLQHSSPAPLDAHGCVPAPRSRGGAVYHPENTLHSPWQRGLLPGVSCITALWFCRL